MLLFGAGVYLLITRRISAAVVLALTFAIPISLILGLGSAEYRWNILFAPTVNALSLFNGARLLLDGMLKSLFVWSFLVTLPLLYYYHGRSNRGRSWLKMLLAGLPAGGLFSTIKALAIVVLCAIPPSFLSLSKTGSSLNHMFEVFVAATTLSFVVALELGSRLTAQSSHRLGMVVGLTIFSMGAFPVGQLALNRMGPMVRASAADQVRKEEFSIFLKSLNPPVFIEDDIYSLPWQCNDNRYPSIMLDHVFYDAAKVHGRLCGGVEQLIACHWFATLYLAQDSPYCKLAIAANYSPQPLAAKFSHCLDSLGRESPPLVLFSAPPGAAVTNGFHSLLSLSEKSTARRPGICALNDAVPLLACAGVDRG